MEFYLTVAQFSFLGQVFAGLSENNVGVFHGKWAASGPVVQSVAPANNKPIANVGSVELTGYLSKAGIVQL